MGIDLGNIIPVVGTVVGGMVGGPAGAAIGNGLGSVVAQAVDGDKSGTATTAGVAASNPAMMGAASGSASCTSANGLQPGGWSGGLTPIGQNTVDTGRYVVETNESEIKVFDKESQTWLRAWGDPHLHTSDGDRAQFHENLTLDLPDGTKITLKTTEKDANGIALIDAVAIMKGMEAVVIEGISDGKPGVQMGNVLNNADAVDARWEDGTVMRAGRQIDDLTYASDGSELIGSDPSQKWGEHLLDGRGGTSINRADTHKVEETAGDDKKEVDSDKTHDVGATDSESSVSSGSSLWEILWDLIAKLEKSTKTKAEGLKKEYYENDGKGPLKDGVSETTVKEAFGEIERMMNAIAQLTQTMTNTQKSAHDGNMAITSNLK